ncbi:Leucine--tRNA ligase subunit alpha, partial [Mycoplasmopsis edwardii]
MAVPAEDERDKDFAIRYNLPILEIIKDNQLINSGDFDGLEPSKAKKAIYEVLADKDLAKSEISYKIRDW